MAFVSRLEPRKICGSFFKPAFNAFESIELAFAAAGFQFSLARLPESIASLGVPDLLRDSEAKLLLWLGCIEKLLWFVVGGYWKWSFTFASMKIQWNCRSRFAFTFNPYDQYEPFCSFETHSLFKAYSRETSLLTFCVSRCFHWTVHCKLPQATRLQIH